MDRGVGQDRRVYPNTQSKTVLVFMIFEARVRAIYNPHLRVHSIQRVDSIDSPIFSVLCVGCKNSIHHSRHDLQSNHMDVRLAHYGPCCTKSIGPAGRNRTCTHNWVYLCGRVMLDDGGGGGGGGERACKNSVCFVFDLFLYGFRLDGEDCAQAGFFVF